MADAPASEGPSTASRLVAHAPAGTGLDRLAELASTLLHASSSQISLITDVQTVVGGAGGAAASVGLRSPRADSLCTVTVTTGAPLVVPDAVHDSRVSGLPPVSSGQVGSYLGVPLSTSDGSTVGALCVFDLSPRSWSPVEVSILSKLASSVVAELELAALSDEHTTSQVALALAIEAAEVGTFDWDLRTGELSWDGRMVQLFGIAGGADGFVGTIDDFNALLHPDDRERVAHALQSAVETCGGYSAEYRIVRPDGAMRWVAARGRALGGESGPAVRVLGAAYDTTAQRDSEARVARVLETMNAAFFHLDRSWRFTYVNGRAERLLAHARDQLLGQDVWELFPLALGTDFETHYRAAMVSGEPTSFEAWYPAPLEAWFEVQAWPDPDGLAVYFLDITERRAAHDEAQQAAARAQLLAEDTTALSSTLEAEEAVARLAQLVVPALADWCLVTLVDDDHDAASRRGLRDVAWHHVDPAAMPLLDRYAELRFRELQDDAYVLQALRAGTLVHGRGGATESVAQVFVEGEARELVAKLAPDSFVVLPLQGRGRTVGMLTLFNGAARGPLDDRDLDIVRDMAGRAGLALDSSRLYRQQRDIAEGLQRSLLTAPVEPDHTAITVRYVPAAQAAQVGGDWYDAFLQPDGATVLVIGDVVGHDTAAAAAMGQVRTLLRGIAVYSGLGPSAVLRGVDAAIETLQVGVTATVVVARVEQTPEERAQGLTRIRWSNAGHPPPMVLHPDGTVSVLSSAEPDLLLGIDPAEQRSEQVVTVQRESTVLFYTDGLVERRGESLEDGLQALREALARLGSSGLPLEQLCDRLLAQMLPEQQEDDVALVAIRLHRQDRPRPAEAGPNRVPPSVPDED
ncbi:PAS domain S-box-containing protein [Motilibacter peucedani]|uniref:PAS domain S-box-containing protein n=1 Tax=Motilibacter peucedani TaxID=598650 RepID=A0A420XUP0_9ACTN|nr:SpoIIE family protein phosphatase [Motilibacter peucedani]RKS80369.1 PAS domain S-box-containing protein [Motilibacter peucedani]